MATKCRSIPVINIQEFSTLAEKIVKACEEWGCFRLVNHGLPMALMSEMKAVTESLFDKPREIKQRNSHPQADKGYIWYTHVYESFCLYDFTSPAAIDDFCDQLDASPHQREIIHKYVFALYDIAQLVGSKLTEGLGLSGGGGDVFRGYKCQLKMNKYNCSDETVGLSGGPLHTDVGFITVLQDDDVVNGLEMVQKLTAEIMPVHPMPGSLVINVGDIGMVWSNARLYNVKHRVQCYEPRDRFSIALFILAHKDEKVEAPPELVDFEHPRHYVPFYFEDYRRVRMLTKSGTGEALDLFSTKNSRSI
ncbi:hypothetical protein BUALT_Bualt18G0035000 [Buddleja alternifolia]|uniref:Fe2OG dioxygenase domain-containing protein n=1 Tax=Buddleja alternifolia TaxID=168488 RepID=A0AAV6WA62_9LAMI|nr:hypothetical protein BUALT_Bualt18G0035000 [Buddleja alternifolia]